MTTKYSQLTRYEIEEIFAEDVLGWVKDVVQGRTVWINRTVYNMHLYNENCNPLTDLNYAWLGVDKLSNESEPIYFKINTTAFSFDLKEMKSHYKHRVIISNDNEDLVGAIADTPQEAIVLACIRLVRPDLFEKVPPVEERVAFNIHGTDEELWVNGIHLEKERTYIFSPIIVMFNGQSLYAWIKEEV